MDRMKIVHAAPKERAQLRLYGFAGSPRMLQAAGIVFHPWLRDAFAPEVRQLPPSPIRLSLVVRQRIARSCR
jgi:hypothetical protein